MAETTIYRGSQGNYHWLPSTEDYSGTVLRLCPEIVLNRYVAVTSVDSGILKLTPSCLAMGWQTRLGVGYTPKIQSSTDVPHQYDGTDVVGYDEFYVFDQPCDLGERSVGNMFAEEFAPDPGRINEFVSRAAFVLHDPDPYVQSLVALFWPQLGRLKPESYIADGLECLTFVSCKKELVDLLHKRLADQH